MQYFQIFWSILNKELHQLINLEFEIGFINEPEN